MSFVKRPFDETDPYDQKVAEVCRQIFAMLENDVDKEIRPELTINVGMALILGGIMDKPVEERMPTYNSISTILQDAVREHGHN